MPSTITHAYFANDIYDKLNRKAKLRVNKESLKTFSQGPDILFFYNIINFKKGKHIRAFGKYIQKHNTQDFFVNLVTYIKASNLENNNEVISFLYGFILHYTLDMTIHPFVFYKTGIFNAEKKKTYKYNGLHLEMETFFDCYLIRNKEYMRPKDFKIHKFCFNINNCSEELIDTINYVFEKTYNKYDIGNIYVESMKQMKNFYRIIRYDPTGLKRIAYKTIDSFSPKHFQKKESLSYAIKYTEKMHYLNLSKNKWNHPKDENEIYNYSFIELYSIALNKAINLIDNVNIILYENGQLSELKNIFPNLSYISGKDCNTKLKTKYFEF